MKQIFDWMREQFKEDIEWYETHGINEDFNRGIIGEANKGISLVDEAKAKWEKDCCEWKRHKFYPEVVTPPHGNPPKCTTERIVKEQPYCPFCGKPIKISEVE